MLTWYAQEHPASCVAACVRMVLSSFFENPTEAEVRDILGHPRLGITLTAAHARLVQAGFKASLECEWSLHDIRDALIQGHYPIVGVERHVLGYAPASHAILLSKITSRQVSALDPFIGPQQQRYGLQAFELAWKLSGKEALVIESPPSH